MLREDKNVVVERINRKLSSLEQAEEDRRLKAAGVNWLNRVHVRGRGNRIQFRFRRNYSVELTEDRCDELARTQMQLPVFLTTHEGKRLWWYLNRFWWDSEGLEASDVQALILQKEQRKQAVLERARTEVFGAQTDVEEADQSRQTRQPIPESVRHEVWRRDQGRCVDCGSREALEFDHIIPVSKGGSNTARNLELRCEACNRRKGATI